MCEYLCFSQGRRVYDWFTIGLRLVYDWFTIGLRLGKSQKKRAGLEFLISLPREGHKVERANVAEVAVVVEFAEIADVVQSQSRATRVSQQRAPAVASRLLSVCRFPRQWVETILHQLSDVGMVARLVEGM